MNTVYFIHKLNGNYVLVYVVSCIVCFSIILGLIKKYSMPKELWLFAFLSVIGMCVVLILACRVGGYADRAKQKQCPNCGGRIDPEFSICPYCKFRLIQGGSGAMGGGYPQGNVGMHSQYGNGQYPSYGGSDGQQSNSSAQMNQNYGYNGGYEKQ